RERETREKGRGENQLKEIQSLLVALEPLYANTENTVGAARRLSVIFQTRPQHVVQLEQHLGTYVYLC
ncbi:hypothetical protein KIPB_017070, partial [Kipferlia bialata]